MKEKQKTILIVLSLIGFITVGVLLIMKIGDIGKLGASITYDANGCPKDGRKWTYNSKTNQCQAEVGYTYTCANGFKWSSTLSKCYRAATKGGNNYYCPSGTTKVTNNPKLGSGTYCIKNRDKKVCIGTVINGKCYTIQKALSKAQIKEYNKQDGWKDGCYFSSNHGAMSGLHKIGNNWYYLVVPGMECTNGTCNSTCKSYRYEWFEVPNAGGTNKSKFRYGYNALKSSTYTLKNGSYNINGTTYKFDSKGYCVSSNCSKLSNKDQETALPGKDGWNKGCYYSGGYPVTGLNKIENKWYYQTWSKSTGKCTLYKYKWHCDKKKKAYWYGYNSSIYLKNGSYNINGTTYKFDSKGYCTGSNCKNNTCK